MGEGTTGGAACGRARLHVVPDIPEPDLSKQAERAEPAEQATASDAGKLRRHLDALMPRVAKGDESAFAEVYDAVTPMVFGLARRVVRQAEQAEEVSQEVMLQVWQQATRFDASRGSAMAWILTMTHRRAVDRVRSAQASSDRELRVGRESHEREHDQVSEAVEQRLDAEAVRECIDALTAMQRESVTLAYFGGYSYPQVAEQLGAPLGTIKTRMRDGLIRLRDCLGVTA